MKPIFNKYKGVYSIWIDPISKRFLREDDPLTQGLTPYSFAEKYFEQEANRYGGVSNIEIVDFTPPPEIQQTVNVSDAELSAYMSNQAQTNAVMPAVQPMLPMQPIQAPQVLDMNKSMQIVVMAQTRGVEFLEGVMYVLQFIDKDLAQTLSLLASNKERVKSNVRTTKRRKRRKSKRVSDKGD